MDAQQEKQKIPRAGIEKVEQIGTEDDFFPRSLDADVSLWSPSDVARCLRIFDLEDIAGTYTLLFLSFYFFKAI